jgi:hypothetical protein
MVKLKIMAEGKVACFVFSRVVVKKYSFEKENRRRELAGTRVEVEGKDYFAIDLSMRERAMEMFEERFEPLFQRESKNSND